MLASVEGDSVVWMQPATSNVAAKDSPSRSFVMAIDLVFIIWPLGGSIPPKSRQPQQRLRDRRSLHDLRGLYATGAAPLTVRERSVGCCPERQHVQAQSLLDDPEQQYRLRYQ